MIGRTLAHYQVLERLGAGGMGEVYRARDTHLDRDVAIKVLPEDFAADPERLARFEREAKLLAQLNHPHIATIHGLEEADGTRFIAMECVEGSTLAEKIEAEGRIEVEEALGIARQITEALEAAHEAGIIHRDLKPANIKVTPEGQVKVLDFGLAKAEQADSTAASLSPDISHSPTMAAATRMGVVMGTAAYMSPEQARGKPVDKRTDIWAFGCVLYEMLAGTRAFDGETVSDVVAAILTREPEWTSLPVGLAPAVLRLLERVLSRDPWLRLRDAGDARIELLSIGPDPTAAGAPTPAGLKRGWVLTTGVAGVVIGALLGTTLLSGDRTIEPPVREAAHYAVPLPEGVETRNDPNFLRLAISPDGYTVVFAGRSQDEVWHLYRHSLRDNSTTRMEGTRGARSPFFSPDGAWIGFVDAINGRIAKLRLSGGAVVDLAEAQNCWGAVWTPTGNIIYTPQGDEGLFSVPENGGAPTRLTPPGTYWRPSLLPDGRSVLVENTTSTIGVVNTATGALTPLSLTGSAARYVASGHLVFGDGNDLNVAAFDPVSYRIGEEIRTVVSDAGNGLQQPAQFAVSDAGTLVYITGGLRPRAELVRVDMTGEVSTMGSPLRHFRLPRTSPDGARVAAHIGIRGAGDVLVFDTGTRNLRRLTNDGLNHLGGWLPDGQTLLVSRAGSTPGEYAMNADTGELVRPLHLRTRDEGDEFYVTQFVPSQSALIGWSQSAVSGAGAIAWRTEEEPDADVQILAGSTDVGASTFSPALSPDGRWVAFVSDKSGTTEVYVTPFPGPGGETQVSAGEAGRALYPIWAPDGTGLYYLRAREMWAVRLVLGARPEVLSYERLFTLDSSLASSNSTSEANHDLAPDGRSFVAVRFAEDFVPPAHISVITDFSAMLEALVPGSHE